MPAAHMMRRPQTSTSLSLCAQGVSRSAMSPGSPDRGYQQRRDVRRQFVQKTFGIVATQLVVTAAVCCLVLFVPSVRTFVLSTWDTGGGLSNDTPSKLMWHNVVAFVLPFVFLFSSMTWQHRYPYNLLNIMLFTLSLTWGIARSCALLYVAGFGGCIVWTLCLTAFATGSIVVYALCSEGEFSYWRAALFVALVAFSAASVLSFVCHMAAWPFPHVFHCACGVVMFAMYLLYDVYELSTTLSVDDHIIAAITIYLDILNLFLQLLTLMVRLADVVSYLETYL